MKEALIRDINGYIAYLNSTGLFVSVHGRRIGAFWSTMSTRTCFAPW